MRNRKRSQPPRRSVLVLRHPWAVRATHWVNALCIAVLLTSGLQIFNAHPRLYFGQASMFEQPVLAIEAEPGSDGLLRGRLKLGAFALETTGVLGASKESSGETVARAFPATVTLPREPDLATGRRFHFFFAWLFAANLASLWLYGSLSGRFARMLRPRVSDLAGIGRTLINHLRLRFDHGAEGGAYNGLQKLTYGMVLAGLLPMMMISGLCLSPGVDAAAPWLPVLLGGRQSARTVHFLCASGVTLFVAGHLVMVAVSGVFNNLRSMITGRYRLDLPAETPHAVD